VGNPGFDASDVGLTFVVGFSFFVRFIISKRFRLEVRRNSPFAVVLGRIFWGVGMIFPVEINVRASADLDRALGLSTR
jgi:hypothetical protein